MKKRQGFVSNSSTSSFIVAIKKQTKKELPEYIDIIELIAKSKRSENIWSGKRTVCQQKDIVAKELKELEEDEKFIEKDLEFYNSLSGNKKFGEFLHKISEYISDTNSKTPIRRIREMFEYRGKGHNILKDILNDLNFSKRQVNDKKLKLLEDLELIKELDSNWDIVMFEEDIHWGALSSMVKTLDEKGYAKILKKETK